MTDFNGILGKYYYYFFSTNFYERAMRMTAKGTVDSVRLDMISKMDIKMPKKISEQKKIADCLTKLDNLITLHQRKIQLYNRFMTIVWEQRKLGELGSVSMCRRIFKEQTSERGDIPFYKIGTFGAVADAFISKELFEEYKLKYPYPKKGDILISASGSIGRTVEFTGKNEYFQDSNIVWLNHDERLSNTFLKCFYSVVKWTGIEGSTIKRLYNDNILNTVINLPSIHEQNKIGAYFAKIDNLITLHQWKWYFFDKKVGNAWEQRKLGKIFVSMQNNTLSRADLSYDSGVAMNVHYGDILVKFGEVLDIKSERLPMIVDETVLDKYKSSFLKNGDIIIADTAEDETVGKCTEIAGLSDEYVISGLHTIPYRPLQKFAFGYLGYYMNSTSYHNQLLPLMQGIKVTSISKVSLQNTVIIYPKSKVEQAAIGKYFYNLDNLITLHQWKWFVYGKIRGIVWIQRKSIKILVIQRKYTLLRVVIVFEWFIICCVCFENIQLRFIAVIEFKIFCIIVDEYVVLIVIECIYVIVVFEVYYALLEFVLIIKSCYVFDDGLFL